MLKNSSNQDSAIKASGAEPNPMQSLRARAELALQQSGLPATKREDPMLHELQLHELELRMQNEALRELHVDVSIARERYRDLFEHAPLPYLLLDRDSTVLETNMAAFDMLQCERSALHGRKLSTFVDVPSVDRFNQHMRAALSSDGAQRGEISLVLADGKRCDVRIESVRNRLHPQQCRSALVDLTQVRQLQRQLERSQRLEAIGTFASGIAHDFSNLLAVVAAGAEVASELIDTPDLAGMPLERIKRAAVQGRGMVRQLLRFASGPQIDSMGVFKLDAAVRGAEEALRQLLGPTVELKLCLQAPGTEVSLDLGGPEEILLNLASNARHAMPNGGELTIETHVVDANVALDPRLPQQTYALVSVSDTGRGMDPRTQARAFEPFFTTKSAGNGTGLGLAMVYGIVKRAGGHIQLTSELRRGTTFRIYLPLCADSASDRPLRSV
jgi:two-component system, cell cycle sensor histidine kinase and response regulator CckA